MKRETSKQPAAPVESPAKSKTAKPTPTPEPKPTPEPQADVPTLVAMWRANPFHFFPSEDVRRMFDIGQDSMTALAKLGAPIVAKKINPDHFKAWLYDNRENIKKLTT